MTKEVSIKISGSQALDGEVGAVETSVDGEYYERNGKQYLVFSETMEGVPGTVNNLVRLEEERMELTKRGAIAVKMVFEKGRIYKCVYQTPYGGFPLEIVTKAFAVQETQTRIGVVAAYLLKTDHGPLADCEIRLEIRAKEK